MWDLIGYFRNSIKIASNNSSSVMGALGAVKVILSAVISVTGSPTHCSCFILTM